MLLEVDGLCVNYGHIEAIRDITFGVEEGQITTLIGANGAGKTTTLKTISGLRKVRQGKVIFDGKDITHVPPFERVKLGVSQAPEGRGCFPGMTVRENLDMGAYVRTDRKTAAYREDLERVFQLFPRMEERINQAAGTLSGGEQQMLAIGRALMARPRLVLLDEPAAGFNPAEKQRLMDLIRKVRDQGYTILLIEHDMRLVMGVTDRIVVLEFGRKIAEGSPAEIRDNPAVIAAYLGVDDEDAS